MYTHTRVPYYISPFFDISINIGHAHTLQYYFQRNQTIRYRFWVKSNIVGYFCSLRANWDESIWITFIFQSYFLIIVVDFHFLLWFCTSFPFSVQSGSMVLNLSRGYNLYSSCKYYETFTIQPWRESVPLSANSVTCEVICTAS